MSLFRSGGSPHQTALAMIGAKAGDAALILGADDADLCAEVARVTGLNGRTAVIDPSPGSAGRLEAAGGRAGGLVEAVIAPLDRPADGTDFDIAVVATPLAARAAADRPAIVRAALASLRPGGRLVVIDGVRKSGMLGVRRSGSPRLPEPEMRALLQSAGAQAIRPLATVDEITYWESRK